MTTRYFTNKDGFTSFDPALNYVSMADGVWTGHRIDGTVVEMSLTTLVVICHEIISGTWVELTEPPKIAPVAKKSQLTLVEAAIKLHKVWMHIRNDRDNAGELRDFMLNYGYADDAWCRVEELQVQIDNSDAPVKDWDGKDDMPIGTVSGNVVEVQYRSGRGSIGFVHELYWPHRGLKAWDIVQYRVIY